MSFLIWERPKPLSLLPPSIVKHLLIVYDDAHGGYARCPWCDTPLRYSEEREVIFCPEETDQDYGGEVGVNSSLHHRFLITR
jgi:hypothetical protein